ncbi:hypothetical protein HWB52_gp09 [Pseudomonas phage Littlefix]|uniref:Uncharacterized protein n=1 Tax=Pseudomonas phage Littlefix TaxID=2079289 RepID=A0A2K9VHK4_9CAUD|nr:hypothetical protein HWB52_gp09 [Pseudomonas phage Littlefix]AUV61824.1 hypothetical protein PsPhLittlefix_gp09 [Pseudomonas phage Littlefix]
MSNANRIHLLSLAAGTLGHIANEYNNDDARSALKAVLADITSLTESGAVKLTGEVNVGPEKPSSYKNDEVRATAGPEPELSVKTPCGCGDPSCALIDVILGNRSDFTIESLLVSFKQDFNSSEVATIVIDAIERVQQGVQSGELKPSLESAKRLIELAEEGKKFDAEVRASKGPQFHVVRSTADFESLLNEIFGKKGQ